MCIPKYFFDSREGDQFIHNDIEIDLDAAPACRVILLPKPSASTTALPRTNTPSDALSDRPSFNGRSPTAIAAQSEPDIRTVFGTARLAPGANPFKIILQTVST